MDQSHPSSSSASRLLSRVCRACIAVAIGFLALVAILVVVQVIARNGFDLGLPWADELARFGGVALVFLSIPLLALRGQHVAVDVVPQLIGGRTQAALAIIAEIGVFLFCAISLYGMHSYLSRAGKFSTPAMGMSNWLFYAPATIGLTLFACVAVRRLAHLLRTFGPTSQFDGQS
ncbi:TRAP transporter small permease [Pseudorhizobium pelagicum]|uniref:TRAP transporter small permease protein n=1 Tax=Pseudorhizobium pelagicum TaxID=1509405 RepID=A0A922NWJ7_9HYPH|nr:TRAP transporter small permease [Pseudorhizobium pelagicum]KEQ02286.1 TRAP transporter small transmembrane protein [Pseudorhizobium pelagicum]KEQ02342.1 TRAP transporter small transmembrane protein [Pseudorhizobium pelagicum]